MDRSYWTSLTLPDLIKIRFSNLVHPLSNPFFGLINLTGQSIWKRQPTHILLRIPYRIYDDFSSVSSRHLRLMALKGRRVKIGNSDVSWEWNVVQNETGKTERFPSVNIVDGGWLVKFHPTRTTSCWEWKGRHFHSRSHTSYWLIIYCQRIYFNNDGRTWACRFLMWISRWVASSMLSKRRRCAKERTGTGAFPYMASLFVGKSH